MPNKELDLVVFDSASVPLVVDVVTDEGLVLSHYVCASLTEDLAVRRRAVGYAQDSRGDGEVPWGSGQVARRDFGGFVIDG